MFVNPENIFQGTVLLIAPHMDDCVLACGGTIAKIPQKERIHIVYATDGMRSPGPIIPWRDVVTPDLGAVRMKEAQAAMGYLGVPLENIHFLGLPEAQLRKTVKSLHQSLKDLISRIKPDQILIPFRYDRHPDHLVINQVITNGKSNGIYQANLIEYFVYYRWRLLPSRDVRKYIHSHNLIKVNIEGVSTQKRRALDHFKSQTTKYYSWQTRPILTSILLDEVSQNPELFLQYDAGVQGAAVFSRAATWIRLVHRMEPFLQKWKYQIGAVLKRGLGK